jgi:DNA transformation protein
VSVQASRRSPLFFGLIADDTLYLKVDDTNRRDFESRGMEPFRPYGERGETMHYYQVPPEVLEVPDELCRWAGKAITVARRTKGGASRCGGA